MPLQLMHNLSKTHARVCDQAVHDRSSCRNQSARCGADLQDVTGGRVYIIHRQTALSLISQAVCSHPNCPVAQVTQDVAGGSAHVCGRRESGPDLPDGSPRRRPRSAGKDGGGQRCAQAAQGGQAAAVIVGPGVLRRDDRNAVLQQVNENIVFRAVLLVEGAWHAVHTGYAAKG